MVLLTIVTRPFNFELLYEKVKIFKNKYVWNFYFKIKSAINPQGSRTETLNKRVEVTEIENK